MLFVAKVDINNWQGYMYFAAKCVHIYPLKAKGTHEIKDKVYNNNLSEIN